MNYSTIKKLYEKLPYVMKVPFTSFFRNKLIKNPIFQKNYNRICGSKKWTEERISMEQFRLYKETLIHAYEHTRYYKELFDSVDFNPYMVTSFENIESIPILTKKILQERFDDLIADDGDEGYLVTTGGSSGAPTKVMMSNETYYVEWSFVYSFWKEYGYDIYSSKLATFRGVKIGNKISEINPLYNEIRMNIFSMGRGNIEKYVKNIKKYGADFIYGYPSAIYNFCKLVQEAGIPVDGMFKAAFLISENLYSFQEKKIKEILKCPIGMFYGHSERAVFAGKSEKGYVFNPLYGFTEIGRNGEPIVTGFINPKTPLIRYELDDKIEKIDDFFVIEGHRDMEVLYGKNGEEISVAAINFHDQTFNHISEYQFIQESKGTCILCVVPNQNFEQLDLKMIEKAVKEKFGISLDVTVQVIEKVQLTQRGKYKMIIQKTNETYT